MKMLPAVVARRRRGFTIVELLVSTSLLATLMLVLAAVTESASRAWRQGTNRTDTFQSARTALELMARELAPAVVDTRMQFVIGPNTIVSSVVRSSSAALADKFAPESPVLLWMAPIGENGALRCVGYYLHRDTARKFYRLKRILIAPPVVGETESPYFPIMVGPDVRATTLRTSPINAIWFTRTWDGAAFDDENEDPKKRKSVVSSAADGVIALWVQPIDLLGNPIPLLSRAKNHPRSVLDYNSAAYFQMATTKPFEDGSFVYLAETGQSMKANRVPAAVDITLVTIDNTVLQRDLVIPEQVNVQTAGVLDVTASVKAFEELLRANNIHTARVFTTRAQLANGN